MVVTRRTRAVAALVVAAACVGVALTRAAPRRATRVLAVHPASGHVPSNLLRVYVEFSAPMEDGWAPEHVRLLDETGRPVSGAFLQLDEELWDAERRRLTLLLDPGRIKRGLRTNLEQGAPLVAGHRYRIEIDRDWRDASGASLDSRFEHYVAVGAFDETSPDPGHWTLSQPRVGSRDPLVVRFDEQLDHALALRMLSVVDTADRPLAGVGELASGDTVWRFTPAISWRSSGLSLLVSAALEDPAGNSIARTFDSDRQHGGRSAEEAARLGAVRRIPIRVSGSEMAAVTSR